MKQFGLLVVALVAGCDGKTAPPVEVDAMDTTDAAPPDPDAIVRIDAPPGETPMCTPTGSRSPPAPVVAPAAGTYCATWTRVSGILDAYPRYYDRADVQLGSVRWWTSGSGGAKEQVLGAGVVANCLNVDAFVSPGGVSGSDTVKLCWASSTVANGTMAWCSAQIDGEQWDVRLDACP